MRLFFVSVFTCLIVAGAFAKDVTWTGDDGAAWDAEGSWSATPESGDRALIPANKTVSAVAADMTTFDLFASIDIGTGATLFFDTVTKAITVPFTGKGVFSANGGSLTFKVNNTNFGGTFALTNTYLRLTNKDGGAVNPLGTTNLVSLYYPDSSSYAFLNGPNAGDGIATLSNEFHLYGGIWKNLIYNHLSTGMHFNGPVYLEGQTGQWPVAAQTSYAYYFDGGLYNGGIKATGQSAGQHLIKLTGGVVSNVYFNCFAGGYYVDTVVKKSTFVAGRGDYGFLFGPNASVATNVTFTFGGSYRTGGYFDLNGQNIQCGDLQIGISTNETWEVAYVKSAKPATLTVRGNLVRHWNDNVYRRQYNGLVKGAASFCYDWDGRDASGWSAVRIVPGVLHFSCEGSDTTGTLTCLNGTMAILATATFPNLTGLRAMNTGVVQVQTAAIGTDGTGLTVRVSESATMDIETGITLAAKTAFVGTWLEPGTYGSAEAVAAAGTGKALDKLTGLGLLTVAEYGGRRGVVFYLK